MRNHKLNNFKTVQSEYYTYDYFVHSGWAKKYLKGEVGEIYIKALDLVEKHVLGPKRKVILGLGCGRGELVRECAKRGYISYGVDYAETAVKIAIETMNTLPQHQKQNVYKIATADVASDNLLADNPDEYGEIVEENFAIFYESG